MVNRREEAHPWEPLLLLRLLLMLFGIREHEAASVRPREPQGVSHRRPTEPCRPESPCDWRVTVPTHPPDNPCTGLCTHTCTCLCTHPAHIPLRTHPRTCLCKPSLRTHICTPSCTHTLAYTSAHTLHTHPVHTHVHTLHTPCTHTPAHTLSTPAYTPAHIPLHMPLHKYPVHTSLCTHMHTQPSNTQNTV